MYCQLEDVEPPAGPGNVTEGNSSFLGETTIKIVSRTTDDIGCDTGFKQSGFVA